MRNPLLWRLFCESEYREQGTLRYRGHPFQALYGYLEGRRTAATRPCAALGRIIPHFADRYAETNPRVYVAADELSGGGAPGFGTFCCSDELRLTRAGRAG